MNKIRSSIDNNNPVLLLFDYYYMFYEENHYLKNHIPHGVVISGYDDERQIFTLRESAHVHFTSLYSFQLTYDIVYNIWNKSRLLFINNKYYRNTNVFMFEYDMTVISNFSRIAFLKKQLSKINIGSNALIALLCDTNTNFANTPQGISFFKRRFNASHKLFWNFIEKILTAEDINISKDFKLTKDKYINFYSKNIKKHFKKRIINCR